MADLTRGITYSVTETITNSKLHSLVDDATIANIVNDDIDANAGISNSKLADIIDAGKVSGAAIRNLPSLPSSAGLIPYSNIPASSLVSIPNISLIPLTLASWVSGRSFKDLASTPTTIGTFPYQAIVPSLASGSVPVYGGSTSLVGKTPAEIMSVLSNVLFSYVGQHENQGSNAGEYTGTSLVPSGSTGNYRFLQSNGSSYVTKFRNKWTKIRGVSTVTVHAFIWTTTGVAGSANLRVNIGSATNNFSGSAGTHTPEYVTFTIDVSGLVDGTVYDVTGDIKETSGGVAFCSMITGIGS